MIQPIYNIKNNYSKDLIFKKNKDSVPDTSKNENNGGFEDKLLKQNQNQTFALSMLTLGVFLKVGLDLLFKKKNNLSSRQGAIFRAFNSLKNDKNIPTIDTCKSINADLKKILENQIAYIKAGGDIIAKTGEPKASNRLLLCGSAGVGKSFFAKIFAKSLDAEYKEILYSDFNSEWIGEHLKNLTNIFEDTLQEAKRNPNKKYVMVFNELDTLLNPLQKLTNMTNRGTYGTFKIEERSIFLNYLEILKEKAPNVTIIGTTNILPKSKTMDQAALSRFQNIIEVPYPDKDCIYEALKINLNNLKNKEEFLTKNDKELKELAEKMAKRRFSFRNLEYVVNEAKNYHLREILNDKNCKFKIEFLKQGEQSLKFSEGEVDPNIPTN